MPDTPGKDSLLVVICPTKFVDFKYDQFELSYFKRYCDVLVLDISMITAPKFSKGVSAKRCEKDEIVTVLSLLSFIRHVYILRKRSTEINICILNAVRNVSPAEFICNLLITAFLRGKCVILEQYNGGVPIPDFDGAARPNELDRNSGLLARALGLAKRTSTLLEARKSISGALFLWLERFMPSATTHRLVAGEHWLKHVEQRKSASNQIKTVLGHSADYSSNLLHKPRFPAFTLPQKKTAVYLDGAGPMHVNDASHLGRKAYYTIDVWYPALTRFFDQIEDQTGVQIEIAGHYKTAHPAIAPCFGNRSVHYGKTRELVWNSEFVVTRVSASLSHAVISKKPIIFVYSNQLKEGYQDMQDMRQMAAMFGNEQVNIDEPPIHIGHLLKIDEERYLNYEKVCLTSTKSDRSNVQIILEDIMDINTGSDFKKTNPD